MKASTRFALGGAVAAAGLFAVSAHAQTVIPQTALQSSNYYYTDLIGGGLGSVAVMTGGGNSPGVGDPSGRNDDGFSGPISLGFAFSFFGQTYNSFYANNNGNISFGSGISAFVPTGPTGASSPVISPWFGDVDTRGANSGVMHVRTDIANEIIVTWDRVGYYSGGSDKLNSFQLVVRGSNFAIPNGEGTIGFFYKDMQWETTGTSQVAAVGFGNGAGQGNVLQGSIASGLNTAVANHHIWFNQALVPVDPVPPVTAIPEPETYALMLAGLGLTAWSVRRRQRRG